MVPGEDPIEAVAALRRALLAGDRAAVAEALHPLRRGELSGFFDLLGDRLPEAASWFDGAELTGFHGRAATVRTVRRCTLEGFTGEAAFDVHVVLDDAGRWKVADF
jgi:hypothetical protein